MQKVRRARRRRRLLFCCPHASWPCRWRRRFRAIRTSPSQTVALVVGGLAEGSQLEAIRRGARLIVATPGRLEDFLKRKLVRLDGVKILVLDEVDRMLDMGFQPAIARIATTAACRPADALLLGHARGRGKGSGAEVSEAIPRASRSVRS